MASSPLISHAQRRTPAIIVAVVLAALGVLGVWVGIVGMQSGQLVDWMQWLPQWLAGRTWRAPTMIALAIAVIVVGLILIIAACAPGRVSGLRLKGPAATEQVSAPAVVLSRRGMARIVGSWAAMVDGADSVNVSTGGRSTRVLVRTSANDPERVRTAVADQVRGRLDELDFAKPPKVVVQSSRTN